jgi:hypothetical protein
MSLAANEERRRIVFVCRQPVGESLRSARALAELKGVVLLGICECPSADHCADVFADLICVADIHDGVQLLAAAQTLTQRHGVLDKIVTTQETLLEATAKAGEALGLQGMEVAAIQRALDKSLLRSILAQAGIQTARGAVLTDEDAARRFVETVGFPVVLKPVSGSGGLSTWCIRSAAQLERALGLQRPSLANPVLAEEFLQGEELCFDTITVANEPRFFSICCYRPSIMDALENQRTQWTCVMPRDISGERYRGFIEQGLAATRALNVGNAMTHMEGFLLDQGGVCFTDATLRPAGARIGPMLAFAYDIDPYFAWARVAVDGCFDGPWERKYAVGTIFLRGPGTGKIDQLAGFEIVQQKIGDLLAEVHLPRVGAAKSATYTGDGYITVRHPETDAIVEALQLIEQTVRISYTEPAVSALTGEDFDQEWAERLNYQELNKPAWESNSALPQK